MQAAGDGRFAESGTTQLAERPFRIPRSRVIEFGLDFGTNHVSRRIASSYHETPNPPSSSRSVSSGFQKHDDSSERADALLVFCYRARKSPDCSNPDSQFASERVLVRFSFPCPALMRGCRERVLSYGPAICIEGSPALAFLRHQHRALCPSRAPSAIDLGSASYQFPFFGLVKQTSQGP